MVSPVHFNDSVYYKAVVSSGNPGLILQVSDTAIHMLNLVSIACFLKSRLENCVLLVSNQRPQTRGPANLVQPGHLIVTRDHSARVQGWAGCSTVTSTLMCSKEEADLSNYRPLIRGLGTGSDVVMPVT